MMDEQKGKVLLEIQRRYEEEIEKLRSMVN